MFAFPEESQRSQVPRLTSHSLDLPQVQGSFHHSAGPLDTGEGRGEGGPRPWAVVGEKTPEGKKT